MDVQTLIMISSAYANLVDVGDLMDVWCTLDRLDYRLRLWASTSASRVISAVAELLVRFSYSQRTRS